MIYSMFYSIVNDLIVFDLLTQIAFGVAGRTPALETPLRVEALSVTVATVSPFVTLVHICRATKNKNNKQEKRTVTSKSWTHKERERERADCATRRRDQIIISLPRHKAPRCVSECRERKPERQVHAYQPGMLRHSELALHSCCPVAHSSTSSSHWAPWKPRRHEHCPGATQRPPFSHGRSQMAIFLVVAKWNKIKTEKWKFALIN